MELLGQVFEMNKHPLIFGFSFSIWLLFKVLENVSKLYKNLI
jgi:hypothetical protein